MASLKLIDIATLEEFRSSLFDDRNIATVDRKIEWYLNSYKAFNFKFGYNQHFFRARTCKDKNGYGMLSDLVSPPPHLTKIGRVNEENSPMFYASHLFAASLAEIEASEGDIIQVSGFSPPSSSSDGLRCIVTGEIYNAYRGLSTVSEALSNNIRNLIGKFENNPHAIASFVSMDALAGEILTKPDAKMSDYIHSRTLAGRLLKSLSHVDGIVYPSVAMNGYTNIALLPKSVDEKLSFKFSAVIKITKIHRYGMIDYDILKTSYHVHEDGALEWDR